MCMLPLQGANRIRRLYDDWKLLYSKKYTGDEASQMPRVVANPWRPSCSLGCTPSSLSLPALCNQQQQQTLPACIVSEGSAAPVALWPCLLQDAERYLIFEETVRQIVANNKDPQTTWWSSLNEYAALTPEEFSALLLSTATIPKPKKGSSKTTESATDEGSSVRLRSSSSLPTTKDWRAEGKVPDIRSQGGVRLHPRCLAPPPPHPLPQACSCICWVFGRAAKPVLSLQPTPYLALGKPLASAAHDRL